MMKFSMLILLLLMLLPGMLNAGITEDEFNEVINKAVELYTDEFRDRDLRLNVTKYWESDANEATAWIHEDVNGIIAAPEFSGGLARHPEITKDAFALVVCHEIGHYLADGPKTWKFSVEGQSDYYGTAVCLKRLLKEMPSEYYVRSRVTDRICRVAYEREEDWKICSRSIHAGESLSMFFSVENNEPMKGFLGSDNSVSDTIMEQKPSAQCRMDTYLAGALCNVYKGKSGTLTEKEWMCQDGIGARPKCWYGNNPTRW